MPLGVMKEQITESRTHELGKVSRGSPSRRGRVQGHRTGVSEIQGLRSGGY